MLHLAGFAQEASVRLDTEDGYVRKGGEVC